MPYREILRILPFRRLWLGQTVSQLGDAFYSLLFIFMVDHLTHSPRIVGYAGAAQALPYLLFGLGAGVVADRVDRRRIMLVADLTGAVLLLIFAGYVILNPALPVALLMLMGFCLSTIAAFFGPAKNAAIPSLVPSALLLEANSLSSATQNLMPVIGIGLSGSILGAVYAVAPRWFFVPAVILNAFSFVISAWFIRLLPQLLPNREELRATAKPLDDLRQGLRYVRGNHVLLVVLALNLLVMLGVSPFMVVYVTVNRLWFGGGFATLALFEFSFTFGMVLGSLGVGRITARRPGLFFIFGLMLVGLCIFAMAYTRSIFWFAFWNLAAGVALPFGTLPITSYIQTIVPDEFRGRVNALSNMGSMGIQPLGIALGALLLSLIGPGRMFIAMGGGIGAAALLGLFDSPFRTLAIVPLTSREQEAKD